jgi:hypothetical protein
VQNVIKVQTSQINYIMSLDDGCFHDDGCFIDAPFVLTEKEYSTKVLFEEGLLESVQQNSKFNIDLLPYDKSKGGATIAFSFGDLLTHVPIFERLKWKEFYKGIGTDVVVVQIDYADKLLFFDFENTHDLEVVQDYWQTRIDNLLEAEDQPWFTKKDKEQASQELHYLNQFDQKTNQWRDLTWMDFMPEVLDKYRNNELCEIGSDHHISFLRHDKTPISNARFIIKDNVLMMYAKEFNNVPPIERSHWNHYQIKQTDDDTDDSSSITKS